MKKIEIVIVLIILIFGVMSPVFAYTIDGYVSDWGINLSLANNTGDLNTLSLLSSTADYIADDNTDAASGWVQVYPGWSKGNYFDAEAILFDNDAQNAYIAIIQGLPAGGKSGLLPGDIAINADNDMTTGYKGFEYGLSISDSHLYDVSSWNDVCYTQHMISTPWSIASGIDKGLVDFSYSLEQNSHYVIEAAIPLALLGLDANSAHSLNINWTQQCGNDYLNLNADVNPVPEPMTMLLFGPALLGLMGLKKRAVSV